MPILATFELTFDYILLTSMKPWTLKSSKNLACFQSNKKIISRYFQATGHLHQGLDYSLTKMASRVTSRHRISQFS